MAEQIQDEGKRLAGRHAADLVEEGMIIGLGTGSTVLYAMERLAERMNEGLFFCGVPTSYQAELRARAFGIPQTSLADCCELDLAIDGADQVDRSLRLIKGRGAAQTRERCIAEAARRLVIVVDEGKLTDTFSAPVPVEVLPFAVPLVARRLTGMGGSPVIREGVAKDGPVITDNGNWVIDCTFSSMDDPEALETAINTLPGVLSCGLFCEFAGKTTVLIGEKEGIRTLQTEI
ncbi:MAG: ribose-5-phosphate isomerase RpiA [Methanomicrobiaceae archaeon]|nr:ribose-5-phosphate isomerase RpiA [Methanomicrobiaceae archaeon]